MYDDIRYPIGPFEPVQNPTSEQRDKCIYDISEISKVLRLAVQNLTEEQLHTPYRLGGWTIQQIVHHMADNDMNAYLRFKKALTEDKPISNTYREDLYAELSDYRNTSIETSLVLLEALHSRFVILLKSLSPTDFNRTFISPAHGEMSLCVATQRYAWHDKHHIAQITSLKERLGWHC